MNATIARETPIGGCLERLVRHIAQMAPHQKDRGAGRLLIESAEEIESLWRELQAYREGGVTEEILRRNGGYIKVGRGCVIALESDMPNTKVSDGRGGHSLDRIVSALAEDVPTGAKRGK
jgi:hypothetical protein